MSKIPRANVKNVVLSILSLAKEVKVTGEMDVEGVPNRVWKENGLAYVTRYMLDEAIMEYAHAQKSNTITSKKNTDRAQKEWRCRAVTSKRKS